MRLHTDKLQYVDILRALTASWETSPDGGGYHADVVERKGSRTRDHAFEIALVGLSSRHKRARAWGEKRASGYYLDRSSNPRAASYDDWGYFIAQLFKLDPDAVFGPYKGVDDFNAQTKHRFELDNGIVTTVAPEPFEVIAVGSYDADADRLVLAAFTGDPR
jgi:hypothetical protein